MVFHEIAGTRRYEYRYMDNGSFTGWLDAGDATSITLAFIRGTCADVDYEVRQRCAVSDDKGLLVGRLEFNELIERIRHSNKI